MKRLASALYASPRGRVEWSLRGLADLGAKNSSINEAKRVSPSTAGMLLHDVSLRLADQYNVCEELQMCLNRIKEGEANSSDKTLAVKHGRVIRAVNNPVHLDWSQAQQQAQDYNRVTEKALRDIKNLQRLHEDTFQLAYGLLEENSRVLSRFQNADWHLCFSTFEQIRSRHATTVETLADNVIALRQYKLTNDELDELVDVFLRKRLGVQLLCDHYVSLHKGKPNGGVSVDCLLADVIDDAVTESKHICDAHFENTPEVIVNIPSNARITLIRPWIHHALVELLKNAMASSFETLYDSNICTPPFIHVNLEETDEFVLLSVLDQGTGVSSPESAFEFASSSADSRWDRLEEQQSYAMVRSPLQSLGVGLPLSRMLLQHFGGALTLCNRENTEQGLESGCTATLYLSKDDTLIERLSSEEEGEEDKQVPSAITDKESVEQKVWK